MARKLNLNLKAKDQISALLFISPWILGFLIFTVSPMIASLYYSFTKYNIMQPPLWIGGNNYSKLFSDELFWQSLKVTVKFAVLALPLNLVIGYLIAVLLNQKIPGVNIWRTLYYLPSVISGVAVAILWMRIFNPRLGWLNNFLMLLNIKGPGWLQDPQWAVPALVIMSIWSVGGSMIIYLSGLQSVPTSLYDAAKIDGASTLQEFFHITLPMTSPVIFFNLVMGLISTFQYFTQAYMASGGTGGPARSTLFYNLYLYLNAFLYNQMGYASAMAWILFVLVLVLTVIVFRTSLFWVYYEGQVR
jgi:multiple sugar transport system permease protein